MEKDIENLSLDIQLIRYDLLNYLTTEKYQDLSIKSINENINRALNWINKFISDLEDELLIDRLITLEDGLFYGSSVDFNSSDKVKVRDMTLSSLKANKEVAEYMNKEINQIKKRLEKILINSNYKPFLNLRLNELLEKSIERIDKYNLDINKRFIERGVLK